jgi:hypothetical protein
LIEEGPKPEEMSMKGFVFGKKQTETNEITGQKSNPRRGLYKAMGHTGCEPRTVKLL